MDPLSITASLIAVIQITTVISSHCMQYVRSAKNTKSLILSLVQELGGLHIVLTTLKELTDRDYCEPGDTDAESIDKTYLLPTLRKLVELEHVFKECLDKLEVLQRDIAPTTKQHLTKRETFFRALNWPIKEAYTKNIMRDISEYISLFSLALTLDETTNVLEIREKTFETNSMVKSLHAQRDDELKRQHGSDLVQWLSAPDASVDYMHALKRKTLNTGTWLLEEHQYKEWKLHPGSLLCIYGTAGSGKTILSSTIVDDMLGYSSLTMNLATAYFYFKADDIAKRTSEGMLRSLLKQLFDRGNRSSEAMMRLFEDKNQQTPVSKLLSTFVDVTFEFGNVYIVLDALDECQDLGDLFDMIEEINQRAGTNVHILFTSRDTKDIKEFVDGMEINTSSIKLSASVVKQDIRTYIRDRLRTDRALKRWRTHPKVQEHIEDSLIDKSDGMFQWVMCQLKELTNCRGPADLRQALARMPKGLNDTYAQMISRISDDDYEVAMRMLYWLLFSVRPLQIEELAELVAMDLNSDSFDIIEHLWDPNDVLDICPGLMTTVEEHSDASEEEPKVLVRLAHISIREYLLSTDILSGKVARFHVKESSAHASIAECCLMYIRLFKGPLPDAFDGLPLGVYVAENWLYHYEKVSETETKIHHLCLDFFLKRKSVFSYWIEYYSTLTPPRFSFSLLDIIKLSPLYIASIYGLLPVLKLMLDSDEIDTKGPHVLSNALRAADRGTWPPNENVRLKTVRFLLKHGADFSGGGRFASTLHGASYFGFDDIVKSELDDGFEVNTLRGEYGTALQAAVVGRSQRNYNDIMKTRRLGKSTLGGFDGISLETVRILLERGANPNIWGGEKGSALFIACSNGDPSCAELLLNSAADPNYKLKRKDGRYAGSCVSAATSSGDIRLLQLLFDHGVHMDCPLALNATALVSDINIMRLLLDKGADPNAVTEHDDETPLQKICSFCPLEAVDLLLRYGADPNKGGGRFGFPLQSTCAAYGSVETMKLLISYGAEVNKIGGAFGAALHAAAFYGDDEMVEYLISKGADVHAEGKLFPTVLRHAIQNGHTPIFTRLLKLGADMTTPGGQYGETLQQTLAAAPADKTELRLGTGQNPLALCIVVKKGASWLDFDNLVLIDKGLNHGEKEISHMWYCHLPDAV